MITVDGLCLRAETLSAEAFAPFGQVIERNSRDNYPVNEGSSQRFNDLAQLEADSEGRLALSIFQAKARQSPFVLDKVERHPLGSQAFIPLNGQSFLIVVAAVKPDPEHPDVSQLKAFISNGQQGINFRRGVWHHPLFALCDGDFLVADRLGPGNNCEEIDLTQWQLGLVIK
ncbi:MAG: ureidoglycolate lyase [Betaproteobacteria bacterium]